MKNIFSVLALVLVTGFYFNASSQCTPPSPTGEGGFDPKWPCANCIVSGVATDLVMNIEIPGDISGITIDSVVLEKLENLPTGLGYGIEPSNKVTGGATACLYLTGTTTEVGPPKQVYIYVSIYAGAIVIEDKRLDSLFIDLAGVLPPDFDASIFDYYLKVIASGATCEIPDSCFVGINDNKLNDQFTEMVIAPNPFNGQTEITFNSSESGNYFAKLYNVVGKEVYSEAIQVVNGTNKFKLERGDLAKGVYMYTITDGINSISERVVIRD